MGQGKFPFHLLTLTSPCYFFSGVSCLSLFPSEITLNIQRGWDIECLTVDPQSDKLVWILALPYCLCYLRLDTLPLWASGSLPVPCRFTGLSWGLQWGDVGKVLRTLPGRHRYRLWIAGSFCSHSDLPAVSRQPCHLGLVSLFFQTSVSAYAQWGY